MNPPFRRSRLLPLDTLWSATLPAPLNPEPRPTAPVPQAAARAPQLPPRHGRPLPRTGARQMGKPGPFDALLDGLDIQELDSQTLFDRFFGPQKGEGGDKGDPPRGR